ncbi:MAG: DNA gyrase subunit A [Chloroflexi bacterium]|nr:DNA gyrase subunit A [Chloroflexota bacterium]
MEVGIVRQVDIDNEMRAAYLDYAMSVIVSRALPDARDGLKPVHRRILYAMYDMGLRPNSPYRKSARIVGEVLGKYHPHGDAAVYDAMVRMAQDFSMRYPLVDGQGNFGSIDGDSAAAMRYTEARMFNIGDDLLIDIGRDTVDFVENFDGSLDEPAVLPSALPNLLLNGSSGIAVGMSTSVPPHNLNEVCSALAFMLDNWGRLDEIGLDELMTHISGPDFPTGGIIFRYNTTDDSDQIARASATGRGKVTVQAKAHTEQLSRNRTRLIITELPYQVNKTNLIERIALLARDEKIEGITDLRDESDRQGLRIVIELTRTADAEHVLGQLYKLTPMRSTFSIIMLALVDGEPRLLSLKQALRVYLEHRLEIIRRRSEYDLQRARERAHILEGLLVALDNLDAVIDTIRRSRTAETAHTNLRRSFSLSDEQATAILNMPLRRLAALERKKIQDEYEEKQATIAYLEELLANPQLVREVIKEELADVQEAYGDPRRSLIVDTAAKGVLKLSELLPDERVWVTLTEGGLISRTFDDQQPKVTTAIKDPPRLMLNAASSETLYLFTKQGSAVTIPVHQLPQSNDFQEGTNLPSLASLEADEQVVAGLTRSPAAAEEGYLFLASRQGIVKRVALADLPGLSARAFPVMLVSDDDELGWATWTRGGQEVILVTADGNAIRFSEEDVRTMGLKANGVKGIKLSGRNDEIVGMMLADSRHVLWTITHSGEAKSTPIDEYPSQGRYGQGVITYKFTSKQDSLACAATGHPNDSLVVVTTKGKPKYMRFSLAPQAKRNATGQSIIALGSNERVAYVVVPGEVTSIGKNGSGR